MNQAGVFLSQNDGKSNIPLNLATEVSEPFYCSTTFFYYHVENGTQV